jgi:co-chaperonin GroES (HSP10)
MNFNPTRDWVVLPIPHKKVTDSGILLSDEAANSLYVHPHTEGVIITVEGIDYVMINEFMILGTL